MKVHTEGYKIILLTLVGVAILVSAVIIVFKLLGWIEVMLAVAGLLLVLATALFFRVPTRSAAYAEGKIFSGADGKVVVVEDVWEDEYFKSKRKQVSVFMSVTDVHVNFAPLTGEVKYFKHHPGKYLFAWLPKASTENEKTTLVIDNPVFGPVMVRQIAGAFARRIVCHPREGDKVTQGSEFGIIKFGSRVDIFLPLHANVKVKPNQHVRGAETLIATI
ncbi:MAG: phosphatidylserine decarboxylase family protein [Bacteroidales bacterium]|nr:phosphatidylserine decarboxylase family protein [Bacteroidales bacterium]